MSLRAAILENWPYKAAAVTLSILLWFNVTEDQERSDQAVSTRLEFLVSDPTWVLQEAPSQVRVTFQGTRGDIIALFNQPLILKEIESVTDSIMEIELSPAEVVYDRSLNVRPMAVIPSRVTLRFERRVERSVAVELIATIAVAEGFIQGQLLIEPESVTVRGATSALQGIGALQTERLTLEDVDAPVTRQLAVRVPPELEGIEVDPTHVLLTADVDQLAERTLMVAVRPVGPWASGVSLSPDSVRVTVHGASQIVDTVAPTDVQATVRIDAELEEVRTQAVNLSLTRDLAITATVSPPRVTVSPPGGGP